MTSVDVSSCNPTSEPTVAVKKAKRAPSAYNQFIKESYAPYKEKFPQASSKDVLKALAGEWKNAKPKAKPVKEAE